MYEAKWSSIHYLSWPRIVDQKVDGYANNPEKASATKIGEQRQLYGHSIILKICIVCIAEKIVWKIFVVP